jgi:uncharacterized membrane protein YidH (DUF202 family)
MDKDLKEIIEKLKQKSWKTSLLGLILVAAAVASVLMGKTNWVDAIVAMTAGFAFVFSKDSDK